MSLLLNNVRVITLAFELKGVRGNGLGEVVAKRTRTLTNAAKLDFTTAIPDSCLQTFSPNSSQGSFRTGTCGDLRVIALRTELRELYPGPNQAAAQLDTLSTNLKIALSRGVLGDLSRERIIFQGVDVYGGLMLWWISSCINGAGKLFFPHDSLHSPLWPENGVSAPSQIKSPGGISGFLAGLTASDVTAFQSRVHLEKFRQAYPDALFAARDKVHIINGKNHPTKGPDFDPEISDRMSYDPLLAGYIKAYVRVLYGGDGTKNKLSAFANHLPWTNISNRRSVAKRIMPSPLEYSLVCSALEKIGCSTNDTIKNEQAGKEVFIFPSFYDVQAFLLLNEIAGEGSGVSFRLPTIEEMLRLEKRFPNISGPIWLEDGHVFITNGTTPVFQRRMGDIAREKGAALILVTEPHEKTILVQPPPTPPSPPEPKMDPSLTGYEFYGS